MSIKYAGKTRTKGELIFDILNYTFMVLFAFTIIFPFWDLLLLSFSDSKQASTLGFRLWLDEWHMDSYRFIFEDGKIITAYLNTIFRTVVGTCLSIIVTIMGAYPLSKKDLPGRNGITIFFLVTMFFSGGLIPSYMLIRNLGLIDSIWVLILPGLFSVYNMIIMRNYLMSLDDELEDAAFIDGAGYVTVLFKIIIPLSKPIIATIGLWVAVGHWNAWFDCLIYIKSESKIVLQLLLRRMTEMTKAETTSLELFNQLSQVKIATPTVKAATIILTIGPIILVYPFIQKYFVQGIMVGSLKG